MDALEHENESLRVQLRGLHQDLTQEANQAKQAYSDSKEELLKARMRLSEHERGLDDSHVDAHLTKKEAAMRHMRLAVGRIQHGNLVRATFIWRHNMLEAACSDAFQHVEHLKIVVETHQGIAAREKERTDEADSATAALHGTMQQVRLHRLCLARVASIDIIDLLIALSFSARPFDAVFVRVAET